ncbi:24388_t:CDS:1 [Dentiscutata erythropus]|uniref:orotate phosphoribosyltransferase n=1 Tax=Dentiscutata erythropus TaxID=1348616 RepID=A0A9N9DH86_9GLOM|nr:24387_t:CDS:1 [Dentiscutata erythropus]CAG8636238.1 24388_t:CDS:1 [Dentiscutata erythropus]
MSLKSYQREFIEFAISQEILSFGSFILKSGRKSPYFFNAGKFNKGSALSTIGKYYAAVLQDENHLDYDVVFGPAYKGIPLASSTVIALSEHYNKDVPYSFNRKEIKDHGDGGSIVGAPLKGNILIIDDVITAGTAIRESLAIIKENGATPVGVIVAVDRQERGTGEVSAIQQIEQDYGIPVMSIVNLDLIIQYLKEKGGYDERLSIMKEYRDMYGIKK